jgi:DNA-binding XRE family transcriptional regulator
MFEEGQQRRVGASIIPCHTCDMPLPEDRDMLNRRRALAQVVRARRKALGLSRQELADRAGCGLQTINRVESAVRSTSLDRAYHIAQGLDMTLPALFNAMEEHPVWPAGG